MDKSAGLIGVNGELLLREEPEDRGHWYVHNGGRIIQSSFAKLMYDLPDVHCIPPVEVGDCIRIGPYNYRFLGWVGDGSDHILLFKLRSIYVSPRRITGRGIQVRLGDWINFLALRWATILYNMAVRNVD